MVSAAQPDPFPERVLGADSGALLEHVLATWSTDRDAIADESRASYRDALTPGTIAAMCADYRASFHLDRDHEADDRASAGA